MQIIFSLFRIVSILGVITIIVLNCYPTEISICRDTNTHTHTQHCRQTHTRLPYMVYVVFVFCVYCILSVIMCICICNQCSYFFSHFYNIFVTTKSRFDKNTILFFILLYFVLFGVAGESHVAGFGAHFIIRLSRQ